MTDIYVSAAILLFTTLASYAGKKIGVIVSSLITVLSVTLVLLLGTMPIANFEEGLVIFCLLYPGVAWFGFWLGGFVKKRQSALKSQ